MTSKRMRFLKELFGFMGLAGRLRLEWISSAEAQKFVKVMSDFTEEVRALGPNPLQRYAFSTGRRGQAVAPGPSAAEPVLEARFTAAQPQRATAGG